MPLWLYETATQSLVEAKIIEISTQSEMAPINQGWAGYSLRGYEHSHWDWERKFRWRTPEARVFALECYGETQGLMFILMGITNRLHRLPLLYVDYLASAPWNLPPGRFKGCGSVLLQQAIIESQAQGWEGRIGLHSLPQAEGFYQNCGMIDFGTDNSYEGLSYFEMGTTQADAFLNLKR